MLEYLEDLIETDPHEEFPQDVQQSGAYVQKTGDALLDDWQEKAARGQDIDFGEAFDAESRKTFEQARERSRQRNAKVEEVKKVADESGDINDDYSGGR